LDLFRSGGDDFRSRIRNLCIEYFHTKAQKLQKVLRTKAQENATEGAVELDVGDNFAARVIHCAVEEGTREILNSIYECESSRLALDAKELRVNELWEKIATDFFNNPSWNLDLFDSERKGEAGVDHINPNNFCVEPGRIYNGTNIRVAFNKLKTLYSVVHANFHASGRNEGDGLDFEEGIESDDLFYENFAKTTYPTHARVLLYAHLLWGKAPPSFCLRTQLPGNQAQVGVKGTNITPIVTVNDRKATQLLKFADKLIEGLRPTTSVEDKKLTQDALRESTARDCEIKNFYRAKTEQIELENRQALSRAPKFHVANFSSVCEFFKFVGLLDTHADAFSARLAERGYRTVVSLKFVPVETLVQVGMLEGDCNLVLGVLHSTAWGPQSHA